MNTHFIKSSEKKQILTKLNEQFGIDELPYLLIESGKEKIRAFSGDLSREAISEVGKIANIEVIGLYLLKLEKNNEFRLSLDGTHALKSQIKKNIINLNDEQAKLWMQGNDISIEDEKNDENGENVKDNKLSNGYCVISNNNDFLGCGKFNGKTIFNHIPKDRRIKSK